MPKNSSSLHLLCDEEPFLLSPTPSPSPARHGVCGCHPSGSPSISCNASDEDLDHVFHDYMEREHRYAPGLGYSERLHQSPQLSAARFRAIQYIILVCSRLNLAIGTAFNAVNYLDRFISMYCSVKWEGWMMELLCIACLSIASKFDEVSIPSLHDLQMEGLERSFQNDAIQQMELAVLKALGWRLSCVTPYSYVELLMSRVNAIYPPLTVRVTEFLLQALLDAKFLEHKPSTVAASALQYAAKGLFPLQSEALLSVLSGLIPSEHKVKVDECQKTMEARMVGPCYGTCASPWEKPNAALSPLSVIPLQQNNEATSCLIDVACCSFNGQEPAPKTKKRKRESQETEC